MPVITTARPFPSAKSIPSATFPRQTAKKTGPGACPIFLFKHVKKKKKKNWKRGGQTSKSLAWHWREGPIREAPSQAFYRKKSVPKRLSSRKEKN